MRNASVACLMGVLLAGLFPTGASGQDAANIAVVYRLFLDQQAAIAEPTGAIREAVIGDLLSTGQKVFTNDNTRAAIRFTDDGSLLRMNPRSELLIIAEGDREAMQKTLRIDVGELWARITHNPDAGYRIETPTAVAAVKGTEFYVRVAPDGSTTIVTVEGVLEFFSDVGSVDVPAGFTAQATSLTELPGVTSTAPDAVEGFGDLTSDVAPAGTEADYVEVMIPMTDAAGNQKVMIIRVPRAQARQFLPPGLN